jgi:hypothetical protein
MAERYLLLEQPRGRERSIRLALVAGDEGKQWNVKRTTLQGDGKGSASEMLERDATLHAAEQRFEFFARNYLERGWYPQGCQQLEKRDLITRFVNRWPQLPHVMPYHGDAFASDALQFLDGVHPANVCLRFYRHGRRTLVRVAPDRGVVLSDEHGLREPAPAWLTEAMGKLQTPLLPAIFEGRLYGDNMALSDLLLASNDMRAMPFAARWTRLQEIVNGLEGVDPTQVHLDPVQSATGIATLAARAMAQGYDAIVARDRTQPYHYGLTPEPRGYVSWENFG